MKFTASILLAAAPALIAALPLDIEERQAPAAAPLPTVTSYFPGLPTVTAYIPPVTSYVPGPAVTVAAAPQYAPAPQYVPVPQYAAPPRRPGTPLRRRPGVAAAHAINNINGLTWSGASIANGILDLAQGGWGIVPGIQNLLNGALTGLNTFGNILTGYKQVQVPAAKPATN